jgi:hypothetical protein
MQIWKCADMQIKSLILLWVSSFAYLHIYAFAHHRYGLLKKFGSASLWRTEQRIHFNSQTKQN